MRHILSDAELRELLAGYIATPLDELGPPATSGWTIPSFVRDSAGAIFELTDEDPQTWSQISVGVLSADPVAGDFNTGAIFSGYVYQNLTTGLFWRYTGAAWELIGGATIFTVEGDSGTPQTVGDGDTLTIAGLPGNIATETSDTDAVAIRFSPLDKLGPPASDAPYAEGNLVMDSVGALFEATMPSYTIVWVQLTRGRLAADPVAGDFNLGAIFNGYRYNHVASGLVRYYTGAAWAFLPQDLQTTASPSFAGLTLTGSLTGKTSTWAQANTDAALTGMAQTFDLDFTTGTSSKSLIGMQTAVRPAIAGGASNTGNVSGLIFTDYRANRASSGDNGTLALQRGLYIGIGHNSTDVGVNPLTTLSYGVTVEPVIHRGTLTTLNCYRVAAPTGMATGSTWQALHAYTTASNQIAIPTVPNGFKYQCIQAGTSAAGEPAWPGTSTAGATPATIADGTVIWAELVIPAITNLRGYRCGDLGAGAAPFYLDSQNASSLGVYFAGSGVGNAVNWAGDTNLYRRAANTLHTDDALEGASLSTNSGTNYWTLAGYTASAPGATGYVTITVNGVTYKLLAST